MLNATTMRPALCFCWILSLKARAHSLDQLRAPCNMCINSCSGLICLYSPQDFLTTAFLVTSKDVFYSRSAFCQLVGYFGDACEAVDLPTPATLKPLELWTGKQLFSMLVRPNAATRSAARPLFPSGHAVHLDCCAGNGDAKQVCFTMYRQVTPLPLYLSVLVASLLKVINLFVVATLERLLERPALVAGYW